MLWRVMFLAEHYGSMSLTLEQVSEQIGIAPGTIRNRRSAGDFDWLRSDGRSLYGDVADVAAYLEQSAVAAERTLAAMRHDETAPVTAGTAAELAAALESRPAHKIRELPGVYCLLKNDVVVYVGQSGNVPARITTHQTSPVVDWDSWRWIPVEPAALMTVEAMLIRHYRPAGNIMLNRC